jgi:hypothetical protein
MAYDPPARDCCRHYRADWEPYISRDRAYGFFENGGALEDGQDMAAHASSRTTRLYDRRKQRIKQAEVERIRL